MEVYGLFTSALRLDARRGLIRSLAMFPVSSPSLVIKVGGSLYEWAELGPRLRTWLAGLDRKNVILVPGGGPTIEALRALDRLHDLGEETCHWLALRLLAVNAHFLARLLPGSRVVAHAPLAPVLGGEGLGVRGGGSLQNINFLPLDAVPPHPGPLPPEGGEGEKADPAILDMYRFALADETRPGHLPHRWDVTSDSLALRVAAVVGAAELILLKSVSMPAHMTWEEAGRSNLVDGFFIHQLRTVPENLSIRIVNLRA